MEQFSVMLFSFGLFFGDLAAVVSIDYIVFVFVDERALENASFGMYLILDASPHVIPGFAKTWNVFHLKHMNVCFLLVYGIDLFLLQYLLVISRQAANRG